MTQSRVGVSVVSSDIDVVPVSSALEPNLARLPPPRRLRATPLGEAGESPFNNGPSSISDVPLDGLLIGLGRRDAGIGLP